MNTNTNVPYVIVAVCDPDEVPVVVKSGFTADIHSAEITAEITEAYKTYPNYTIYALALDSTVFVSANN